ncbi:alpha/beta hydrolase, partial [Streptomyces sp. NPDC005389]|uniref:alpha/beta hydrolase n=1 Tax=Streptomyces sp. NPDC005389 TaxID=3157040 RepID=UPI0033B26BA8
RAIIANGNPDTADHTAVYVPGTTTNLKDFDGAAPSRPPRAPARHAGPGARASGGGHSSRE